MQHLTKLPNIGKTLSEKLSKIGIKTESDLKKVGSESAIIKISTLDKNGTCLNMLYALEGAIQGIRWHNLDESKKQELKEFYKMLKRS